MVSPTIYKAVQDAISDAIWYNRFTIQPPNLPLQTYLHILNEKDTPKNERLEFLGDAILHSAIGKLMYELAPKGNPRLYTACCGALWSNVTFCKIAETFDIWQGRNGALINAFRKQAFGSANSFKLGKVPLHGRSGPIKHTADLFESILGAFHELSGHDAVNLWVIPIFTPLAQSALSAYRKYFERLAIRRPYVSASHKSAGALTRQSCRDLVVVNHSSTSSTPAGASSKISLPSTLTTRATSPLTKKLAHRKINTSDVTRQVKMNIKSALVSTKVEQAKLLTKSKSQLSTVCSATKLSTTPARSAIEFPAKRTPSKLPTPATSPDGQDPDTTLVNDSPTIFSIPIGKLVIDLTVDEDKPIFYTSGAENGAGKITRGAGSNIPGIPSVGSTILASHPAVGANASLYRTFTTPTPTAVSICKQEELCSEDEVEDSLILFSRESSVSTSGPFHNNSLTLLRNYYALVE